MLTPVDIQQKKFKTGLGYNKEDVNQFFHEVSVSYEELYRSNAELKEKVITMEDSLQHYKATEENLQKSLLLAEKNSEESKTNAAREARNIEAEARSRANEIVKEAREQLADMENRMKELEAEIEALEASIAEMEAKLTEPEIAQDYQKLQDIVLLQFQQPCGEQHRILP